MNSSSSKSSPTKKHAVITIEPLNKDSENNGKVSSSHSASRQQYPSDALAELQRQQRKRLAVQICTWLLWIMIISLVASIGYGIYYFTRN